MYFLGSWPGGFMRILVVEDDKRVAEKIRDAVTSAGYMCDVTHSGQEGLDMCNYGYDLIILDRVLSDMDALDDLLPRLRYRKCKVPVIFLSALSGVDYKVKALEYGADDYIVKPHNKNELLSRIRAVVRRTRGHISSLFKIGNMTLDFHKQICTMSESSTPVPLTNKEYGMLELLCLYGPGTIVSKEKFINHLYSNNEPSDPKIIDVFMCKLRYKLASANNGVSYIETVWGRGYSLNEKMGHRVFS